MLVVSVNAIKEQHVKVAVCIKGTAKTLDQRDCASPCRGFGVTGFVGQMCGNSAVDDAQHLAHDGRLAGRTCPLIP